MTEPRHDQAVDAAGKDSPTGAESTLSSDVRDLFAAIRDALDVPMPDVDVPGGWDDMRRLALSRARIVHLAVGVAAKMDDPHLPTLTENIRDGIASYPVAYPVWHSPEDGGERA